MDYDEWLRQKEGTSPFKSLEDVVNRTIDNMYKGSMCPQCGCLGATIINDHAMKCNNCGNFWTI